MPLLVALAASLLLAGCALSDSGPEPDRSASQTAPTADEPPRANEPLPGAPAALANRLTQTQRALEQAIDRWRSEGDPREGGPPRPVVLLALHQQRIHLLLIGRRGLASRVLARVSARVAASARATIVARRGLGRITPPAPRRRPGADAVHRLDVEGVRDGRRRPRSARCDPRRRELPPR